MPYCITQTQTSSYDVEVGYVDRLGAPQPQHNQQADIESSTGGYKQEALDVLGDVANSYRAYSTHGSKTDQDWPNVVNS